MVQEEPASSPTPPTSGPAALAQQSGTAASNRMIKAALPFVVALAVLCTIVAIIRLWACKPQAAPAGTSKDVEYGAEAGVNMYASVCHADADYSKGPQSGRSGRGSPRVFPIGGVTTPPKVASQVMAPGVFNVFR